MPRSRSQRVAEIADAGIRILATRGRHALTHRAVDTEAGLPPGSASYYARTRDALVGLIVERIAELDIGAYQAPSTPPVPSPAAQPPTARPAPPPLDRPALAQLLAESVHDQLTRQRARTLARYELSLEAAHNTPLRATLNRAGQQFRTVATALLAAAGSPAPDRQGRLLVAICDGIVFDSLVGAGSARPPTLADIQAGLLEVLRGVVPESPPPGDLDQR